MIAVNPAWQQRLAVLVPLVALGLSLFIVYPAWGRYRDLEDKIVQQRSTLNTLKSEPLPKPGSEIPAADDLPSEPPQFLTRIRALASAAGCDLKGFDITAPSGHGAGSLRPVSAKVQLLATYPRLRRFVSYVVHSDRILTITDIDVSAAKDPGFVDAAITIERYVSPPPPKAKS